MGVYTTRPIPKGEKVLATNDGLAIPLYAFRHTPEQSPNFQSKVAWKKLWIEYVWSGNKPDHISWEQDNTFMSSFAPCYSSLTNHHCLLSSLRQQYPEPWYDDSMLNRFSDPGAGAVTYDAGRENTVGRNVQPGEELFLNYGYCEHGPNTDAWADKGYMPSDYRMAKKIVLDFIWKSVKVKKGGGGMVFDNNAPNNNLPIPENTDKLVTDLLPKTRAELEELKSSVDHVSGLELYMAEHMGLNHPFDPEWVRANGMCLENILPRQSTIFPQAGRGGLAQFRIKKGDMVAPAPLLQIMDKEALTIYEKVVSSSKSDRWNETGKQLLLNYCWGHPESTMLLCPQTNVVLLNHCSDRSKTCGPHGPNAAIRWASRTWHASTPSWLKMSLDELSEQSMGGLAFEVVALRDIQPDEEVFIDYGIEWEDAWESHVANWKRPPMSSDDSTIMDTWISAKVANDLDGDILDEMVTGDLRHTTNHTYLFTGCYYKKSEQDEDSIYYQQDADWTKLSDEQLLERYADDNGNDEYGYREYAHHRDHSYWPCSVLKRNNDATFYTVRIHQSLFSSTQPWAELGVPRLLTNYPRSAIHYFVKPNMSDQQLDGAFRHSIGIPNDMFPEQWKNLRG